MESSSDDNMEQMAGSAGDLEVTKLARPINKVLSFFENSYLLKTFFLEHQVL